MKSKRFNEDYRGYRLVATLKDGQFLGRVWKNKEAVFDAVGRDLDDTVRQLKQFADEQIEVAAMLAGDSPDEDRLTEAFSQIHERFSDGQLAMLKAHFNAPNQIITATELAEAAGYKDYSAANLKYGEVGKMLYELAPIDLKKRDGVPVYTYYLAQASEEDETEEHFQWKLRPEVAGAIAKLGLNT